MIAAIPLISSALSLAAPTGSALAGAAASTATGSDFGQMMAQVASDTVQKLHTAESASIDGIKGDTNVQSVVQAVMSAQESLQTSLAIRDKAVAAFQDVTKMSI